MNANTGHPALRARIAAALSCLRDTRSASSIANLLGVAVSTITRRDDLSDWPATELLQLAATYEPLSDAIVAYLTGEKRDGLPLQLQGDLLTDISNSAAVSNATAAALKDGHLSVKEIRAIRATIAERRRHEDESLLPAMDAAIESVTK